jgi:hypothetical protein
MKLRNMYRRTHRISTLGFPSNVMNLINMIQLLKFNKRILRTSYYGILFNAFL